MTALQGSFTYMDKRRCFKVDRNTKINLFLDHSRAQQIIKTSDKNIFSMKREALDCACPLVDLNKVGHSPSVKLELDEARESTDNAVRTPDVYSMCYESWDRPN